MTDKGGDTKQGEKKGNANSNKSDKCDKKSNANKGRPANPEKSKDRKEEVKMLAIKKTREVNKILYTREITAKD